MRSRQPTTWCTECKERLQVERKFPRTNAPRPLSTCPSLPTEDRVVGTLDIEQAIQKGERHFEPGVLAAANRGLLYIDEVNLLDDHVVDVLLDSAAMGVNIVEREGISFAHPARFILVGTMNPEEGELRPQLLDRFALSVDIVGIRECARTCHHHGTQSSPSSRTPKPSANSGCRKKRNSRTRSSAGANWWTR